MAQIQIPSDLKLFTDPDSVADLKLLIVDPDPTW